jgi:hypothetical protein
MKKRIFGPVGKTVGVAILALIVLGPVGMAYVGVVSALIGVPIAVMARCGRGSGSSAVAAESDQTASGDANSFRRRYEAMKPKVLRAMVCIWLVFVALIGWKVYEEYRFQQNWQRVMEQLGER